MGNPRDPTHGEPAADGAVASYDRLAPYFDDWQQAFGAQYYELVLQRVVQALERYGRAARRIADLGAGTGGLACALAARGYSVVGIDRSRAMLAVACRKARSVHLPEAPTFLVQDLRELSIDAPVDAAVCIYTVINHLIGPGDLDRTLGSVFRSLVPGGVFIFELNLPACYERYWSRPETIELGDVSVVREHFRAPATPLIEARFTIRQQRGRHCEETYDRIEQRLYEQGEVERALDTARFTLLERVAYNPFDPTATPVKALWIARRA